MKKYTIHIFVALCLITYTMIGFAHKPLKTVVGMSMIVAGVFLLILSYGAYYNSTKQN